MIQHEYKQCINCLQYTCMLSLNYLTDIYRVARKFLHPHFSGETVYNKLLIPDSKKICVPIIVYPLLSDYSDFLDISSFGLGCVKKI